MVDESETHVERMQANCQQHGFYVCGVDHGTGRRQKCRASQQQVGRLSGRSRHVVLKLFAVGETMVQQTKPFDAGNKQEGSKNLSLFGRKKMMTSPNK